ncbi:NAD(P)H-hydrate dehydratase [Thiomicrospira sp.]|uniref:NAD(P)H-hydrate dehydratase n=1 Tax=Thiomicrospira sp. TaxID=935 RepID=UPI002F94EDD3
MLKLYSATQAQAIDRHVIKQLDLTGLRLMKRAAGFANQLIQKQWPQAQQIYILCGPGNNGGDGYALAKIAHINGQKVDIAQIGQPPIEGDAAQARQEAEALGLIAADFSAQKLMQADLVVDALFGIGLNRPLEAPWNQIIDAINMAQRPILALDLPSGLDANTGQVLGSAIQAQHTACFIVQKIGLYLNDGPDHTGQVHLGDLQLPIELLDGFTPLATSWEQDDLPSIKRRRNTHKGTYGSALLIGGNYNMVGALALAGKACLRSGVGLCKLVSRAEHQVALSQIQPELMCYQSADFHRLAIKSDVIAIGPGLGTDSWAWNLYEEVCKSNRPLVLDADALNCLALEPFHYERWILTPHPGEASRLLERPTHVIQNDRISAIQALHKRYGGVIVLKGAGSLIYDGQNMALCRSGNPGMAVGGMGDVLTGLIAGLVAQGFSLFEAAQRGVELHARAGDKVAQSRGQSSLLPSDIIDLL